MGAKVLIFDSGVGGLSIYKEVIRQNPWIQPYYLFDNAFYPYGTKPEDLVIERVCHLLSAIIGRFQPTLIVIACNTASTVALEAVRAITNIPVVGVVPAIKPAAKETSNGIIGLLATPATIGRKYTQELIRKYASNVKVLKIGSSRLVDLAENKLAGRDCKVQEITEVLEPWLALDENERPDTIILGCTHFPHLAPEIKQVMPKVRLVDSGEAIGRRVKALLGVQEQISLEQGRAFCTNAQLVTQDLIETFKAFGFSSVEAIKE